MLTQCSDSIFLNPHVWQNCTNIWKDYHYCVKPVGYISTYPGNLPPTTSREFIQTPTTRPPVVENAKCIVSAVSYQDSLAGRAVVD